MTTLTLECGQNIFKIVMPNHHIAHEWRNGKPGSDIVNFYPRMFAHLRTTVIKNQINVNVSNFVYFKNNEFVIFHGTRVNMTSYIPAGAHKVRLALLSLDLETNNIVVTTGTAVTNLASVPIPLPSVPANSIPSALIKLKHGAIKVREVDITDARVFLFGGRGSGGSSSDITLNTDNFNNILSVADDTVQKAFDTLDDLDLSPLDVNITTITAGENLSALRAVVLENDGKAYYASPIDPTHRYSILGVTTQAILTDDIGNVRVAGELGDNSWNWTEKAPIFLGANGTLTQTVPTADCLNTLGYALNPDEMFIRISQPILLA